MPTYEYECKHCGERLEAVQSFHDPALTVCPNCGGELRKVFGAVGIVFKGSGFYKTDSRSSGNGAKKSAESSSGSSESSSGSSESSSGGSASADTKASEKPASTAPAASNAPAPAASGAASSAS